MQKKVLAEKIILQAADDIFDEKRCEESVAFFSGAGFRDCAAMAGMTHEDMVKFLEFINNLMAGIPARQAGVVRPPKPTSKPFGPETGKRAYLWY